MSDATAQAQPPSVSTGGNCVVCGVPSTLRCKACSAVNNLSSQFYCSKKHQAQDWKAGHRLECGGHSTRTDTANADWRSKSDRFIASRELPTGHHLFTKKPLVVFPRAATSEDANHFTNSRPTLAPDIASGRVEVCTCVGCNELLLYNWVVHEPPRPLAVGKCRRCGWPVHSGMTRLSMREFVPSEEPSACEIAHAEECKVFTQSGLTWDMVRDNPNAYLLIGCMRAIALPKEGQTAIRAYAQPQICPMSVKQAASIEAAAVDIVRWCHKIGLEFPWNDKRMISPLITQLWRNMLPIPYYPQWNAKLGFVIYEAPTSGRVLRHSCRPNTALYFDKHTMKGNFRTIRPVAAEEELTITYLDYEQNYHLAGIRMERLVPLLVNDCDCPRCSDWDTEGGTFYSANACPLRAGEEGHWLWKAQAPTVPSRESPVLICAKPNCGGAVSVDRIREQSCALDFDVKTAVKHADYDMIKAAIAKYSDKIVHRNHFMLHLAWIPVGMIALREIMGQQQTPVKHMTFDLHHKYMADFDRNLEILAAVQPGRTTLKGAFLFGRSLLKISALAERVKESYTSTEEPHLEAKEVSAWDEAIEDLLEEAREAEIIFKESPLDLQHDVSNRRIIRTMYVNHLVSSIEVKIQERGRGRGKDNDDINMVPMPNFEALKREFAEPGFDNLNFPITPYFYLGH